PLLQGGLLVTAIAFIFVQDIWLGFAAVALFPVQGFVIPRLQRQVNALNRERVLAMRRLAARLGETSDALSQVRVSATDGEELKALDQILQRIYEIRNAIFKRRSFIKLLNNFLFQVTPFLFLLIGGYLVMRGEFTIGALVAVLAAYKDLPPPARELLDYYQSVEEVRLKYEQVVAQFDQPEPMPSLPATGQSPASFSSGALTVSGLGITRAGNSELILDDVSFDSDLDQRVAIIGLTRAQGDALARALVGLNRPVHGSVRIAGWDPLEFGPDLRKRVALLSEAQAFFNDTLRYNLFYGLEDSAHADTLRAMSAVEFAQLQDDMQHLGMNATLDAGQTTVLAERLVAARHAVRERLTLGERVLIEPFDESRFCEHATIGENLIWGKPVEAKLDLEELGGHPAVRKAIQSQQLSNPLQEIGIRVGRAAATGQQLAGTNVDRPLVYPDELAALQITLMHADPIMPGRISARDRLLLHSIALRVVPARHTFCTVDKAVRDSVVKARQTLLRKLTEISQPLIAPLRPDQYNPGLTVRENLLFGAVIDERPTATVQIESALMEILVDLDLGNAISQVGLEYRVGNGGRRLTPSQRQRLNFARAWLREPGLSVISGATSELAQESEENIVERYTEACRGRCVVWILDRPGLARYFDSVLVFSDGQLVEQGRYPEVPTTA
ncbi:MAG: ABC transporter transmembrane domain-containing protein, partial [Gammaproteobacteria bacterium]|nr:ABC transporter transmembrane domain-containing protein [Gammaproteobacteria bacterium]